ncbi:MAG: hypothetical protein JW913_16105 [Chitinispirillaceae bacterium]|nr:hypothetical protein [Chitinispirillaceae bacterium]
MKRQTGVVVVMSLLLLVLVSCAAQFPFIAPAALSEATDLKELCAQRKLTAAELKTADSLYNQGSVLAQKKKNEAAYPLLDRAIVYYRVALSKAAILRKEKEIAQQERALSKTREDVSAYNQVLKELKTMEQK